MSIPINDDELIETNEKFFVKMKAANDDSVQFQQNEAVVIIATNDGKHVPC